MTTAFPINNYVVKVHSRCNLDCTYCYEYNLGNDGWKRKPRAMTIDVFDKFIERAAEHARKHGLKAIFISFHGGEPLIQKPDFFDRAATLAKKTFEGVCEVNFGVQTNATLMTNEFISVFRKHNIVVGTSIDGPQAVNDKFRIYKNGKGSHRRTEAGISLLSNGEAREIWGGILSVIDVTSRPIEVLDYLLSLNPPTMDFLEPDGHWDKLPPGKENEQTTEYADWLIAVFDRWFENKSEFVIRRFENIIEGLFGGYGNVEYFGTEPITLLTIATDGAYEAVDQIKSVKNGIEVLELNAFEHAIDEVLQKPIMSDRQSGESSLAAKCLACEFKLSCGGGYYPHRYSAKNGFKNPSIYCADYLKLFRHIQYEVNNTLEMATE